LPICNENSNEPSILIKDAKFPTIRAAIGFSRRSLPGGVRLSFHRFRENRYYNKVSTIAGFLEAFAIILPSRGYPPSYTGTADKPHE
jgi:hypothetical protein